MSIPDSDELAMVFILPPLMRQSEGSATVALLSNGELDTLALRQRDPGLLLANDEDVALTSGKLIVNGVLDVDNVETTVMALPVGDDANTTHVATAGRHGNSTSIKLDEIGDLSGGEIDLDSVVDLDRRVRVADSVTNQYGTNIWATYSR